MTSLLMMLMFALACYALGRLTADRSHTETHVHIHNYYRTEAENDALLMELLNIID